MADTISTTPPTDDESVSPKQIRRAGVLYLVLGIIICAPLLYFAAWTSAALLRADDPAAALQFNGTRFEALFVIAAVLGVFAIGVTAIVTGVWQIRRGTRNPALVRIAGYLYLLFWIAYWIVRWLQ